RGRRPFVVVLRKDGSGRWGARLRGEWAGGREGPDHLLIALTPYAPRGAATDNLQITGARQAVFSGDLAAGTAAFSAGALASSGRFSFAVPSFPVALNGESGAEAWAESCVAVAPRVRDGGWSLELTADFPATTPDAFPFYATAERVSTRRWEQIFV